MKARYLAIYAAIVIARGRALDLCPDGSYVLGRGLSPTDRKAALDEHNRFRSMLVNGEVRGQPRAKYMKTMEYDDVLAEKCVPISNQCVMNHLPVEDGRWKCVGQNIYIAWHSQYTPEQNWTAALASWFYECDDFKYPNIEVTGREVGHYTQVAWADSDTIGCDFILFLDARKPWTPFCSLYTCNYAPCGNCNDLPPYELADPCESYPDSSSKTPSPSSASSGKSSSGDSSSSSSDESKSKSQPKHDFNIGKPVGTLINNILQGIWGKKRL